MSANAQHFARVVLDAFRDAGLRTDEQVGDAGGPSTTTMGKLRKAAEGLAIKEPRSDTLRRIDAAAGWRANSAQRLWHEGELPDRHDSRPAAPSHLATIDRVETRIERDASGEIVGRVISTASVPGGVSRLEVSYWPGAGRSITTMDLLPAVTGVHRRALEATYMEGGDGDADADARGSAPIAEVNELEAEVEEREAGTNTRRRGAPE